MFIENRDPTINSIGYVMVGGHKIHTPRACSCGDPVKYGRDGVWYCDGCWMKSGLGMIQPAMDTVG